MPIPFSNLHIHNTIIHIYFSVSSHEKLSDDNIPAGHNAKKALKKYLLSEQPNKKNRLGFTFFFLFLIFFFFSPKPPNT